MVFFCEKCFKDKDPNDIFQGWVPEYCFRGENDECPTCGVKMKISILNDEEFETLRKIADDSAFFKAMEDLKRTDPIEFQLKMSQFKNQVDAKFESNVPKCPTCGSTNIEKIRASKRWITVGLFGLGSSDAGKSMRCRDCGYKW